MKARVQFVEYDPRAHKLLTLASFSYWVSSMFFQPASVLNLD